jgi:UDP-glucuronate 4-epimerase
MQPGDVYETCADVTALMAATGFSPDTPIEKGVTAFVAWYRKWLAGNPA